MALIRIDRNPSRTSLRVFALLWMVFAGAAAFALWRRTGSVMPAAVVAAAAVVVPLAGELWPALVRWLYVALSVLTWPIGWVVSHLLLAVVYYLVLTPLGWILRAVGHVPQQHSPDPKRASYWTERRPAEDARRYFRQF